MQLLSDSWCMLALTQPHELAHCPQLQLSVPITNPIPKETWVPHTIFYFKCSREGKK